MEPNTKLLMDELKRQDERWERRFAALEKSAADRASAIDSRLAALESASASISAANDVVSCLTTLESNQVTHESVVFDRLLNLENLRLDDSLDDVTSARVAVLEQSLKEVNS
jgi:hypothetical protein